MKISFPYSWHQVVPVAQLKHSGILAVFVDCIGDNSVRMNSGIRCLYLPKVLYGNYFIGGQTNQNKIKMSNSRFCIMEPMRLLFALLVLLSVQMPDLSAQSMVKDIYPGASGSMANGFINVNGILFFSASDGTNGTELWRSDGSSAGTAMVKDINAGSGSSFPGNFAVVNGNLYFSANDGTNGYELWKSDGTAAGTILVKDINTGSANSLYPVSPFLTNNNGTLFFSANDGISGNELWKSDGTAAGTVMVKDINPGFTSSMINEMISFNNTLYFQVGDAAAGAELWKSDGTDAGTFMVKDIEPGSGSSSPRYFVAGNTSLFFTATTAAQGLELWKTDGTGAGTILVKDINPGPNGSNTGYYGRPVNINGTIYFSANDGVLGNELWKSDGVASGTVLVKDIQSGVSGSNPGSLRNVNGTLFFQADDGVAGKELWKTDGTLSGTVLVKDINPGPNASNPEYLVTFDGQCYFQADNGSSGTELWKSDGNASGTIMVKDINAGSSGGFNPNSPWFTEINGVLYFAANDGVNGRELWRHDGTVSAVRAVPNEPDVNIYPNPFSISAKLKVNIQASEQNMDLVLYNTMGQSVSVQKVTGPETQIHRDKLVKGFYFYMLKCEGKVLHTGRLAIE
jgi:trimeric autotransporter adhesin